MAKFVPGTDTQVKSDEPHFDVLASANDPLKPGKPCLSARGHRRLGQRFRHASITIIVQDTERPTAVVDLLNADGKRISDPVVHRAFSASPSSSPATAPATSVAR